MTFFLALLAGIAGAAVGAGAALLLMMIVGSGIPTGDIGAAFLLAAVFLPIGVLTGLGAGVVLTLRSWGIRSRKQVAGYLAGVLAVIVAVTGAVLSLYIFTIDDIMNPNGPTPLLAFEVRLPAGAPLPAANGIELITDKNRMPGSWNPQSVRKDGDRTVFAGEVEMYFKVWNRLLAINLADTTQVSFEIDLARTPPHSRTFGGWHRAAFITEPGKKSLRASPQDGYDVRYRAAWVGKD